LNNSVGVSSEECHQNTVKDNLFLDNDGLGITLVFSNDWIISGNTIMNNNGSGIYLFEANNNTISDNKVVHNMGDGIHLWWLSNGNNIVNNNVSNNDHDGILLYFDCVDNNVTGNNVYSNNWSGITLAHYAEWNNISGNIVSLNNLWGIVMVDIYNGTNVTGNTISYNNGSGIYMELSRWNNITGNIISSNTEYGIYLVVDCDWNNIISNMISNNSYGIYIFFDSSNNRIYHNDFINNNNSNSPQVFDDSNNGNFWDNGYPSGGNYWSDFDEPSEGAYDDYKGPNQDIPGSDDIVDNGTVGGGGKNPYVIDADSQDNYPFMGPFNKCMILKQGWNLISIPLIQNEQILTKMLDPIGGLYSAAQWYDSKDPNDPWKNHKVGKPFGNDLKKLNETMGLWVYITEPGDTIFHYNGTIPTQNQTITLHPGWNQIGYPSLRSYNRTEGLNNLTFGQEVDSILTYDAATQKWKVISSSDHFKIGRGYWIHAETTCVWEVPL
jgi:parallel beta-helix repeat protein